jgi:hypothetical protein
VVSLLAALLTGYGRGETIGLDVPSAHGQCPTDFFVYFNDSPDSLAPGNDIVNSAFDVPAITLFDPDGTGPQAAYFVAAIHYIGPADCANQFTISSEWSRLDRFDSTSGTWIPITPRFDGVVTCLATFDENPTDGTPPALYIGGRFSGWSGINSPNIMRYNGAAFSAVRNGLNNTVWCMRVHDDDGPGVAPAKLYMGGQMSAAHASDVQPQINCGNLIRLTGGQRWENPSSGFNDAVFALSPFDEDGPGAGVAKLAVGGAFTANGTANHRLISLWDGANWSTLGTGLDPVETWPTPVRRVFSLSEFDDDGAGPHLPSLFVGGTFYRTPEGLVSPQVIRWNRNHVTGIAAWLSVPSPVEFDTENAGSQCLNYCSTFPYEGKKLRVLCMTPFDTDGTGAGPTELFIGGNLHQTRSGFDGYDILHGLMKWNPVSNTTDWVLGDSGTDFASSPSPWSADSNKFPLTMMTIPGNASVPGRLLIGGGKLINGVPVGSVTNPTPGTCPYCCIDMLMTIRSNPIVAWGLGGAGPAISNQPDNTWINSPPTTSAGFGLVASGTGPFTYRWRRNGADLENGAAQGFGGIIGATGSAVILGGTANPVNVNSQGWYDCRVTNACGTGYASQAWLVVQPDATPYFPIRFDSPVEPVVSTIGNADLSTLLGLGLYPRFFTTVAGTPFAIAPTGLNTWRSRTAPGSATGDKSITIPTSRFGVGEVYTLINTEGGNATEGVRLSFSASGGLAYTVTLTGGNHVRSHLTDSGIQTLTSPNSTPVYISGNRRLDKQRIELPNTFRTRTLTSVTITDRGTDATSRAFVAGLTLMVRPPACGSADVGSVGGFHGADGILDNNDFIVFIDLFFAGDLTADFGRTGGLPGGDGILNNNDFIAFIDAFFNGC